jgi:predicted RNase H-like HicB family nuclease
MKVRRLKRRTYDAFNSVDASGYTVRFARAKDGYWCAKPDAFMPLSNGATLKEVKRHVNEAIQICLEDAAQMGRPVPKPEWGTRHASR